MQHVMIRLDTTTTPHQALARPCDVNIWRDDQNLMWMIEDDRCAWDNDAHPDTAVSFRPDSGWTGSTPVPSGAASTPDRRPYIATGPGPRMDSTERTYAYDLWVKELSTGELLRVVNDCGDRSGDPQDPDISNQPHP
jgi:hypothetical protein